MEYTVVIRASTDKGSHVVSTTSYPSRAAAAKTLRGAKGVVVQDQHNRIYTKYT